MHLSAGTIVWQLVADSSLVWDHNYDFTLDQDGGAAILENARLMNAKSNW